MKYSAVEMKYDDISADANEIRNILFPQQMPLPSIMRLTWEKGESSK